MVPRMSTSQEPFADAARRGRRIGHAVEVHATIGSTNDRARALLASPAGEGTVVVAVTDGFDGRLTQISCHCMSAVGAPTHPDAGKARADFCVSDLMGKTASKAAVACRRVMPSMSPPL